MKKFSLEYSYCIDEEQVLYRRTFSSFSSLRDYIISEFSTFDDVDSFEIRCFDTEYLNIPRLF